MGTPINPERIAELTAIEAEKLNQNTLGSKKFYENASKSLSGGVASQYQAHSPWPIYVEKGDGPKIWDVDGNEYYDFHNGFGSMVQGHAHPAIGRAVTERYASGTHFAAPTEDAVVVAEDLPVERLVENVEAAAGEQLQRVVVFDVYRGRGVDSGRKSIALGLILQDAYRTLTDADADRTVESVALLLERELGAKIRT